MNPADYIQEQIAAVDHQIALLVARKAQLQKEADRLESQEPVSFEPYSYEAPQ